MAMPQKLGGSQTPQGAPRPAANGRPRMLKPKAQAKFR